MCHEKKYSSVRKSPSCSWWFRLIKPRFLGAVESLVFIGADCNSDRSSRVVPSLRDFRD